MTFPFPLVTEIYCCLWKCLHFISLSFSCLHYCSCHKCSLKLLFSVQCKWSFCHLLNKLSIISSSAVTHLSWHFQIYRMGLQRALALEVSGHENYLWQSQQSLASNKTVREKHKRNDSCQSQETRAKMPNPWGELNPNWLNDDNSCKKRSKMKMDPHAASSFNEYPEFSDR